jgi:hypothetical protein
VRQGDGLQRRTIPRNELLSADRVGWVSQAEPSASADPSKLVTGPVLEQALNVGRVLGLCMSGSSVVRCPRPRPYTMKNSCES